MPREEHPKDDGSELSELETALAALVPRAERLNRDRLMFLAGQASAESKIGIGTGGAGVSPATAAGTAAPHCPVGRPWRRAAWAWPTAFAAMTGIAASLLLALAIRPAPQVSERIVERIVTTPSPPAPLPKREGNYSPSPAAPLPEAEGSFSPVVAAPVPDWLALMLFPQPDVNKKCEPSYPQLRKQVLLHGLESWKLWAPETSVAGRVDKEPATAGEELKRLLEQEGDESPRQGLSTPMLRNPSGTRS